VSYNFQISPKERLSMIVSVESVSPMGYASHIEHTGSMEALAIVREALKDLAQTKISDAFIAAYKEHLKNQISFRMQEPMYWVDAMAKRFLDGKDFTTSYAAKIDSVTEDKVKLLLLALNEGSKVEYVVK
jgi:predicted Zn-dependent peptidase